MTGRGVWNKITRRKPNGANNRLAHRMQPDHTKPVRARGNISTLNACTRRSDFSKLIPNSKFRVVDSLQAHFAMFCLTKSDREQIDSCIRDLLAEKVG